MMSLIRFNECWNVLVLYLTTTLQMYDDFFCPANFQDIFFKKNYMKLVSLIPGHKKARLNDALDIVIQGFNLQNCRNGCFRDLLRENPAFC